MALAAVCSTAAGKPSRRRVPLASAYKDNNLFWGRWEVPSPTPFPPPSLLEKVVVVAEDALICRFVISEEGRRL